MFLSSQSCCSNFSAISNCHPTSFPKISDCGNFRDPPNPSWSNSGLSLSLQKLTPLLSALRLPTLGDYLEPNISHPLLALISTCLSLPQDFNHFHFCLISCHISLFCLFPFLVRNVEFLFLPAMGMSHPSPAHYPAPHGLPVPPHAHFAFFPSQNSSSPIPVHVSHLLVRLLAVQGD